MHANIGDISMEISISYIISAARVIKDATTNKNSVIDVFDIIQLPSGQNFTYQSFYVHGKLLNVPKGNAAIDVRIMDPTKEKVVSVVNLAGNLENGDVSITAFFALVKFTEIGRYQIKLSVNGSELEDDDRFYFDIIQA